MGAVGTPARMRLIFALVAANWPGANECGRGWDI
jgi:hypothetical protein